MVITCSQCSTRFHLDETRITGERVKARCSSCRHLFWVSREGEVTEIVPEIMNPPTEEFGPEVEAQVPPFPPPLSSEAGEPLSSPPAAQEAAPPDPGAPVQGEVAAPPRRSWKFLLAIILIATVSIALGVGLAKYFNLGWRLKHFMKGSTPASPSGQATATVAVKPPPAPPSPQDLKELAAEVGEARFQGLFNVKGGRMLVIGGEVKNTGKQPRGPVRLKVVLTDPQNRPLQERLFYAGTVLTEEELKKLAPEDIDRWLDTPGGRSRTVMVRPGERQTFTVVFFGTPEKLAEGRYGYTVSVFEGPAAAPLP